MGEWLKSVLPASVGFCLYRSAATFLYNSGMGMYHSSVGFVSDLSFVLAANVCACIFAVVLLCRGRIQRLPWWSASPWVAAGLIAVGALAGWVALGNASVLGVIAGLVAAGLCGVALTILSVVWLDFFVVQGDAARVLAQIAVGYTLYTALTCLYAWMPMRASVAMALAFIVISAGLVQRLKRGAPSSLVRRGSFPGAEHYSEFPTYVCFFVLVGVVGIMHTSVIGSSAEYVIAVPMWVTRIISLAAFLLVVVCMGQSVSLNAVFKWVFPILIVVLTLLPFVGGALGSLTGIISIVGYNVCGMVFYLFIIREGRRLDLSGALLAGVYMLGSSGTLLVGLVIGMILRAVSASFDLSLLTVVAFAAIYPLVLVLMLLLRRERAQTNPLDTAAAEGAQVDEGLRGERRQRAVMVVADRHGLTRREREVLGYLAAGRSVKYVAETLVISENTAWTHAKRIYAKTGTHGKQELIDLVEAAL